MMLLLPPVLRPPRVPTRRMHRPKARSGRLGYRKFRPCLRWEFSFICPFCLVHEVDLGRVGVGTGPLETVEHYFLKGTPDHAHLRNEYENCFLACWYCNTKRGRKGVVRRDGRARLLNPSRDAWGAHFTIRVDGKGQRVSLQPNAGDADAIYTESAYSINDPVRVAMRWNRYSLRRLDLRSLLQDGYELLAQARERPVPSHLVRSAEAAMRLAEQYSPVPTDCPLICECVTPPRFVLKPEFAR